MIRIFVIAWIALAVLAGCGSRDPGTTDPQSSETSAPPAPVSYESVYDLRAVIESSGIECDPWEVLSTPVNAVERALCGEHPIAIHADAAQAQMSVEEVADGVNGIGRTSVHVTGPNWSINCGEDEALGQQLAEITGGDLQVSEPGD